MLYAITYLLDSDLIHWLALSAIYNWALVVFCAHEEKITALFLELIL